VTVRFRLAGMDFLVLFECKRHASAVKREHLQVLHAKMQSTGRRRALSSPRLDFRVAHCSTHECTVSPA
jgi:hypothetical protein